MPDAYRKGEAAIVTVMDELCVKLGFCLSSETRARIVARYGDAVSLSPKEIDELAREVIEAEGLPEPSLHLKAVRAIVARRLGERFG